MIYIPALKYDTVTFTKALAHTILLLHLMFLQKNAEWMIKVHSLASIQLTDSQLPDDATYPREFQDRLFLESHEVRLDSFDEKSDGDPFTNGCKISPNEGICPH